jgi:hypothetical protein
VQQTISLQHLSELAADIREKISSLPYGPERHMMLRTIWQSDDAAKLEEWLNSLGLQQPK